MIAATFRGDNREPGLYAFEAMTRKILLAFGLSLALASGLAAAASFPCRPCAGLKVDNPLSLLGALDGGPALAAEARLLVGYELRLDRAASPALAVALAGKKATPWLAMVFDTPAPLAEHARELQEALAAAVEVARVVGQQGRYQIVWRPMTGEATTEQYAFLLKHASVAIAGAAPSAWIVTQPLAVDEATLRRLYDEGIAAYVEAVAFAPAPLEQLARGFALLAELDPGRPAVVDGVTVDGPPARQLVEAARLAATGASLVLFRRASADAEALAPLRVLANEFHGDLSYDAASAPQGAAAWVFVRGEDLGLRVIVEPAAGHRDLTLRFADPELRAPERVDPKTGTVQSITTSARDAGGLLLHLPNPGAAAIVRVARASASERAGGVAEKAVVTGERELPVEEILRRLQASEDAQARNLRHFSATNATTLRFALAAGIQTIDATFEGDFFFRQGKGFDWAWQTLYINGVRWRGKSLPEIPLIQPEKAAAMPLEIQLTKDYTYRLRGRESIAGRDGWVVDFEPAVAVAPGRTLYRGTVWIDHELALRLRTRTLQLGLTGEVLSNEETLDYSPVDATGKTIAWSRDAFVLPLHTRGQQILSIVNTTTVLDRESQLTNLRLNGSDFDQRRDEVLAGDVTMVRDTAQGLRYLVKDEKSGERKVKEGYTTHKLFALAGVFYDRSLDYPLPLVGLNYFDLDFRGGKRQLNAFFGGVLGVVNFADPRFRGSKFDLGADAFLFAYPLTDRIYRDGKEVKSEDVREIPARVTLNLGYPLGAFTKVELSYRLSYSHYRRGTDTVGDFVLPSDHVEHQVGGDLKFSRSGFRLDLQGAIHQRSQWKPWGLPGNPEYDPDTKRYATWEATLAKNWYLPNFQKLGIELDGLGGSRLDRFSKYSFGFFGGNRVHGYPIGQVRAEKAQAMHVTYGFEIGEVIRLDAVWDGAWATDRASGLERRFLSGAGLVGTLVGPWETIVNLDLGHTISGPASGYSVYVVFLKLFH